MPSSIAILLCSIFIIFLFRTEYKLHPPVASALWIPTIWLTIIASRPISTWFHSGIIFDSPEAALEGSFIDAAIYFVLILAAFMVLAKRKVSLSQFLAKNGWISVYFLFGLISIIWSDFPISSFKRWIKSSAGNIMMCLIILSDHDPVEALKIVIKRCAYLLLPTSIMLIKYFPELGRKFDPYQGVGMNIGITEHKNALGYLCLVTGFILFWSFVNLWRTRTASATDRKQLYLHGVLLSMIAYLFKKAHSATSLGSFLIGICVLIVLGLPFFRKNINHLGSYVILGLFLLLLPFMLIGPDHFMSTSVEVTGHESTFWGRVELWKDLINLKTDPLIGTGYESFWNSRFAAKLWENRWWKPTEAHNGYLETYINIGGIGLLLLIMLLISSFKKIRRTLISDFEFGKLKMGFLIAVIFYNITEASFKGLNPVWFVLLLLLIDPVRPIVTVSPMVINGQSGIICQNQKTKRITSYE